MKGLDYLSSFPPQSPFIIFASSLSMRRWHAKMYDPEGLIKSTVTGIPGWRSGLAPAFGPGHNPGDPESSPARASCMEPASPSACVSASLSLSLSLCYYHE